MPPPWSPKIYIEKDNFLRGTPLGQTTTFFIKVKVEKYADYSQPDGLVLKYTIYDVNKLINIFRITKRLKLKKSVMFINIEAINLRENIDIHLNLRQYNFMDQVKCLIGKKSRKLIEE